MSKQETIIEPIEKYGLSKRSRAKTLFSRIGIIGCGKDGSFIAMQAAMHGIEVIFLEPDDEKIANAFTRLEARLDKKIQGWGMTEGEKKLYLGRITGTSNYDDLKGCDFVIEAIRYNNLTGERCTIDRKNVFKHLEEILSPKAIIATNVTTVTVSDLAADLKYKERCIGLHFLSNVPESNIMEVARGIETSDETYSAVCSFSRLIKHEYIPVIESASLVGMRLFLCQLNEACAILMEGISTVEDIDRILIVGFGYRQGVFRTADYLGIEKIVKLLEDLYTEYGYQKYKPSPILLRKSRAKHYGVSRRRGFYEYDESGNVITREK